jgi:hypothetical protein
MVRMRKKGRKNLKNKAMGQIIEKRMMRDKKNRHKKKVMKKSKKKNNYKQIHLLKIIINQHMVVSL